jgi:hypothetical protein
MKRERRQPARREWEQTTSRRTRGGKDAMKGSKNDRASTT